MYVSNDFSMHGQQCTAIHYGMNLHTIENNLKKRQIERVGSTRRQTMTITRAC